MLKVSAALNRRRPANRKYTATNGMRNHPSYRVSEPADAATPAPAAVHSDCVSRNRTVKYSNAASDAKNTASVMGIDARYSAFGFSAYNAPATAPAAALVK